MIIQNQNNQENNLYLSTVDKTFVDYVNNMVTGYGQIPYTVPVLLIIDAIKYCTRFFHERYYKAVERRVYILAKEDIDKNIINNYGELPNANMLNEIGYQIQLPGNIKVIKGIKEVDSESYTTSAYDTEEIQIYQRTSPYGLTIQGINDNIYLIERACRMIEYNALNSVFGMTIPFAFNQLTNKLQIKTHPIKNHLIIDCSVGIDCQYLYNNDLFIKYVVAITKRELKRVLGSHTIELPGGVTLNIEEICNNIDTDMQFVEDYLKGASGIGDIIITR